MIILVYWNVKITQKKIVSGRKLSAESKNILIFTVETVLVWLIYHLLYLYQNTPYGVYGKTETPYGVFRNLKVNNIEEIKKSYNL